MGSPRMACNSSFALLSDDLCWQILAYIDSSKDLSALSSVNKSFHTTVSPSLYRRIEWKLASSPDFRDSDYLRGMTTIHRSLVRLLRTMLARSDLASCLEVLSLRGDDRRFYDSTVVHRLEVHPDMIDPIRESGAYAIESTGVSFTGEWSVSFLYGRLDALLSLLVSLSPCLKDFDLGLPFSNEFTLIGQVFHAALIDRQCNLPRYANFKSAVYELNRNQYDFVDPGSKLASALPFFYAESLQTLVLALDNPDELVWVDKTPSLPALKFLEIHSCRESHLPTLLAITPHLITLRWFLRYSDKYRIRPQRASTIGCTIDLNVLGEALLLVRWTLMNLTIGNRTEMPDNGDWAPNLILKGDLRNLRHLSRLHSLIIPLPILAAAFDPDNSVQIVDVAPSNIETLSLTDELFMHNIDDGGPPFEINFWDGEAVYDLLETWLQHGQRSRSRLRTINLLSVRTFPGPKHCFWVPRLERLTQLGVSFRIGVELIEVDDVRW